MKTLYFISILGGALGLTTVWAQIPSRDTADYPPDPRVIAVEFFQHIRAGDAAGAWRCWDSDLPDPSDRKYEEMQVRNSIGIWIADFRLEQALEKKFPSVYEKMKESGELTPAPELVAKAKFTTFRRLAIIRWSEDEDAGLPLVLDTSKTPPKWMISLSQYRETTRASVGDSFRSTDAVARATDHLTRDILSGKVKTERDLEGAPARYLEWELKKAKYRK